LTLNILEKTISFATKIYYLFVRSCSSMFFFDFLYRLNKDPFKVVNSNYESEKLNTIKNVLGKRKFKSALDIGCGTGYLTVELISVARRITGIDISKTAIKTALENFREVENIKFICGDVCDFDTEKIKEHFFDLFICSEILYYLNPPEIEKLLKRIHLISAEDSYLIFIGRADDNYVKSRLENFFIKKKEIIVKAKFKMYYLPFYEISRPYSVTSYEIR